MPTVDRSDPPAEPAGSDPRPSGGLWAALFGIIPLVLGAALTFIAPTLSDPSWVPFVRALGAVLIILGALFAFVVVGVWCVRWVIGGW